MPKLAIALAGAAALLFAGILTWNAEATPLAGAATGLPNSSLVEKVGCYGGGICPFGRRWICPPYRPCWCAPCGAYKYRYRYRY
jgi:hypothetical protein